MITFFARVWYVINACLGTMLIWLFLAIWSRAKDWGWEYLVFAILLVGFALFLEYQEKCRD